MMIEKKIVFLSGTRADYGKIKSLIRILQYSEFQSHIFVCGMHLLEKFGLTYNEILKDGFKNVFLSKPFLRTNNMDLALSHTIKHFSNYVNNLKPDLIVVHGDRLECLAGAIVGAFNNILVAHIEGGEISGTIDEGIRHAVSKLSHIHFVANNEARERLRQLGEDANNIYEIGSPDIDIMLNKNLPDINSVKNYYKIPFKKFLLFAYHPVTTSILDLDKVIKDIAKSLRDSKKNFVIIYPNNDLGSNIILKEIKKLKKLDNFRIFPSIRFEYFLTLLKNCECIVGNSSSGIREAPVFGTPCIDIGNRQEGRYVKNPLIQHINNASELPKALQNISKKQTPLSLFGNGDSAEKFLKVLNGKNIWSIKLQKRFFDI